MKKVCVVGLGNIGLPVAEYCQNKNLEVYGYDISDNAVYNARLCGITSYTNLDEIPSSDVYHICISVYPPNFTSIFEVAKKINEHKKNLSIVSVESTVSVGICRKLYEKVFNKKVRLIHVPHRFYDKEAQVHGVKQTRVFGYINKPSFSSGIEYYTETLKIPLIPVEKIEIAELCKIAENSSRFVNIAFAENLKMVCDKLGLDFESVRFACNSKWNIKILEARDGILGDCLPKDIKILSKVYILSPILIGSILTDDIYKNIYSRNKKLNEGKK